MPGRFQNRWLLDDRYAAVMRFGDHGFEGAMLYNCDSENDIETVRRCCEIRDRAARHAVPFTEYPGLQRSA